MNEPEPADTVVSSGEPALEIAKPVQKTNIFRNAEGIRPGWRFFLYLLMFFALYSGMVRGLRFVPQAQQAFRDSQNGTITHAFDFMIEAVGIIAAFIPAFVMARIERRQFGDYGIPWKNAFGRLFWQGILWGLIFESAEVCLISALGGFSFGTLALSLQGTIFHGVLWAIGFVMVGFSEEFLFRGYTQFTLSSWIGFWPSAIVLSALFGGGHLSNPGEGWVGALSVFVFAMFGCFVLQRTGNLWFMIGFHAAGDYAETFIYSTPDSGLLAEGHLLNSSFHGPKWLTGGSIGPEGSVIDFVLMLAAFLLFAKFYPAKKAGASG